MSNITKEQQAEIVHNIWSHWMKYLLVKVESGCGVLEIKKDDFDKWTKQMNTPYSELSEEEKESDREVAELYLNKVLDNRKQSTNELANHTQVDKQDPLVEVDKKVQEDFKVGDEVYFKDDEYPTPKHIVKGIIQRVNEVNTYYIVAQDDCEFNINKNTAFKTREEAEQSIKEKD